MRNSLDKKFESNQEEIFVAACLPFCAGTGKASTEKVRELLNEYSFLPEELDEIKKSMIKGAMLHVNNYQNSEIEKACRYIKVAHDIDEKLGCVVMYWKLLESHSQNI